MLLGAGNVLCLELEAGNVGVELMICLSMCKLFSNKKFKKWEGMVGDGFI